MLIYRDAFVRGGLPSEVRGLARGLALDHAVSVWGRARSIPRLERDAEVRCYTSIADLAIKAPRWLRQDRPDVVVLFGVYLPDTMVAARAAKVWGAVTVLHPSAHIMHAVLTGKVFFGRIDIGQFESGRQHKVIGRNLRRRASPILKQMWLRTVGLTLFRAVDCIAVLSDHEEREIRNVVPSLSGPAVKLRWGIDQVPGIDAPEHYYRDTLGIAADGCANIVFWARLDWHYKGLDRLLAGVLAARRCTGTLPFRLFLCGPGYAGGLERAKAFIAEHSLERDVRIIPSFGGSKAALRDADASVLLSRWDGLPRSLRESLWLGVPVITSRDTHAGHLLRNQGAGIVVENPDQPEEVAAALLAFGSPVTRSRFARNARRLKPHLGWDVAARNFIAELPGDRVSPRISSGATARQA